MNNKCKCKNPNEYTVINGIGIRCQKCLNWISKVRKCFCFTKIKESDKIYDRNKEKNKLRKEK